jgi:hypothetical protein
MTLDATFPQHHNITTAQLTVGRNRFQQIEQDPGTEDHTPFPWYYKHVPRQKKVSAISIENFACIFCAFIRNPISSMILLV